MVNLIIIGGPTGSGKSALALDLAERIGGEVVNADSMQQYRDLRIVTARPTLADHRRARHHLYGHLPAETPGSVGTWLSEATRVIGEIRARDQVPIVVGGTGLYLKSLLKGIAAVPDIPSEIRMATSERFDELGVPGFHQDFSKRDPEQAALLEPGDRQRLIRAAEVLEATGKSLLYWRSQPHKRAMLPEPIVGVALMPPRPALHRRIELRLQAMIDAGALDELETLQKKDLPTDLPLMKAVAVPELLAYLGGSLNLATATTRAVAKTRQYAKRQLTWLRHQLPELEPMDEFGDRAKNVFEPSTAVPLDLLTDLAIKHTVRSTR